MDKIFTNDYTYLILGSIIIFSAFLFSKRLGNAPVVMGWDKIGFSLNADRLTLFFLFGFLVIAAGIYIRFQGYEDRLTTMERDLEMRKSLADQLSVFKEYDFDLALEFQDLDISPRDDNMHYFKIMKKDGKFYEEIITPRFGEVQGVSCHSDRIKPGDRYKIVAENKLRGVRWESDEIEVPTTAILLRKSKN